MAVPGDAQRGTIITLSVFLCTIKNQNEVVSLLITYYLISGTKTGVKNGSASWFLWSDVLVSSSMKEPTEQDRETAVARVEL